MHKVVRQGYVLLAPLKVAWNWTGCAFNWARKQGEIPQTCTFFSTISMPAGATSFFWMPASVSLQVIYHGIALSAGIGNLDLCNSRNGKALCLSLALKLRKFPREAWEANCRRFTLAAAAATKSHRGDYYFISVRVMLLSPRRGDGHTARLAAAQRLLEPGLCLTY